jgi:hypothetical protein
VSPINFQNACGTHLITKHFNANFGENLAARDETFIKNIFVPTNAQQICGAANAIYKNASLLRRACNNSLSYLVLRSKLDSQTILVSCSPLDITTPNVHLVSQTKAAPRRKVVRVLFAINVVLDFLAVVR